MDLKDFRPGLLPLGFSPRLAIEAVLVAALALSLIYAGSVKRQVERERK